MERSVLNEKEAALFIGCSAGLLRKWRSAGQGPCVIRLGRLIRYRLSELEEFLAAHQQEPRRLARGAGSEVGEACLQ
jgi:predicted DNA-binding transcriptional regulator AlpA